jgi:hypothetical protein
VRARPAGACASPSPAPVVGRRISADDLCGVLGTDPAYTAWAHERFQELLAVMGSEEIL